MLYGTDQARLKNKPGGNWFSTGHRLLIRGGLCPTAVRLSDSLLGSLFRNLFRGLFGRCLLRSFFSSHGIITPVVVLSLGDLIC